MYIIDPIDFQQAFEKLTTKQKAVLALRSSGYTQEETRRILGISRTAVGGIEASAIAHLRKQDLGHSDYSHITVIRK